MYIKYIKIVYTENLDSIYMAYAIHMICIFCGVYTDIPKLNVELLHAGQGHNTLLAPPTVSFKCLDEIDADILPETRAASVILRTVRGAHHFYAMVHCYTGVLQQPDLGEVPLL
jgi:hypothetical protein